jgi:hypothetical protein
MMGLWVFVLRYHRALIGVGAILALFIAFRLYVNGQVEQARLEDAAAVAKVDAIADDVAGQVAASEAATIQQGNDDARREAVGSDDPLKRGLDSLRAGKTSNR